MSGRRFAILIASSRFPNEPGLPPLQFPENDADGLSKVLRSEERGNFDDVVVLKNKSLSNPPNPPAPFPEREGGDIITTPLSFQGRGWGRGWGRGVLPF